MLKVFSPANQTLITELQLASKQEVENKISTANRLFTDSSQWMKPHERIEILEKVVELMKGNKEELIKIATNEGGKPISDTTVEVERAIGGVKIAISEISQLSGKQVPMELTPGSENRLAFTILEPIGVVGAISAFNHPLNLIIHQTVTAIAAGCPVIIKPALTTPLSCIKFVELLVEAGLPSGWCQVIICENDIAERLVTDKRINYFSFIGSSKVGWELRSKLAPGTRCGMEHGGAAPVIIENDADYTSMLPDLLKGGFYHAGQVCVSIQRIYVQEKNALLLADKLGKLAEKLVVGDPMDAKTEVGPLILPKEVDRIEQWVEEAIEGGAQVMCGGKRTSSTYYQPTVLLNPSPDDKVSTQEIFGPVVCVYSCKSTQQAIDMANKNDGHFQAAVFTKNIDQALNAVKKLNASTVMVNDHTAFRVDWMPFGGRDTSGIGVGGIQYSMKEMTREKLIVIKSQEI